MEGFHVESEFDHPCYGIKLTPEQRDLIKDRRIDFVRIDGKSIFEVRTKDGKTDGYIIFVVFL